MGPNLLASSLVRHDVKGSDIGKVLAEGRLEKGMPAFPQLTHDQVTDLSAFVHARIDAGMRASALGASAFAGDLAVGDAAAGKVYFQQHCATCHNVQGNFAGIAARHDPSELEALMLAPKAGPATGTVTLADGSTVQGDVLHADEFSTTLRDRTGAVQTFAVQGNTHFMADDPLRAHRELLPRYTNKDIHDVFSYLETLR